MFKIPFHRAKLHRDVKVYDNVRVELFRQNRDDAGRFTKGKELIHSEEIHNLVVTAGLQAIADRLSSSPGTGAMSHMAIGTGAVAASLADTTLGTELDRNALTSFTDAGAVITYVGTWAAGDGTGAITESGIFNAASSGTMLARAVFSVINKGSLDTLVITHTITFS